MVHVIHVALFSVGEPHTGVQPGCFPEADAVLKYTSMPTVKQPCG